ncbi:MAG: hypothetical protein ACE5G5_07700 [Candidatus Methylomirabilales bacterium]
MMKKYLTMALGGLLVVAMALPSFAQEIKVTGQVRVRLRYWVDLDLDSDVKQGGGSLSDRRYFDNRTRLGVDAKLAEGVRARIELEKYFDFGNVGPNGARSGATAGAGELATIGGTVQEPYFRQAWLDFQIPGLPEGWRFQGGRSFFSVGHQFLWGNSLTGEDGLTLYGPLGPGTFKGRFAMTQNQSEAQAGRERMFDNELNHWAVDYKFDVAPKQTVELYVLGQHDRAVDNFTDLAHINGEVRRGDDYYLGAAYSGFAGPVALKLEGAFQTSGGTRRDVLFDPDPTTGGPCTTSDVDGFGVDVTATPTCTIQNDIDRRAGFIYARADYKVVPEFTTGINISWASGDDTPNDDRYSNFVGPLAGFVSSPTRVFTDSGFFAGNRSARRAGNSVSNRVWNFWGRGSLDIDSARTLDNNPAAAGGPNAFSPGLFELKWQNKYVAAPNLSLFADIAVLWADKKNASGSLEGDESRLMGGEIDLKAAYKPYKNLVINGYFGYWITGGFFQTVQPGARRDNAWVFRTEIVATF